jgi:hypothetical protein
MATGGQEKMASPAAQTIGVDTAKDRRHAAMHPAGSIRRFAEINSHQA